MVSNLPATSGDAWRYGNSSLPADDCAARGFPNSGVRGSSTRSSHRLFFLFQNRDGDDGAAASALAPSVADGEEAITHRTGHQANQSSWAFGWSAGTRVTSVGVGGRYQLLWGLACRALSLAPRREWVLCVRRSAVPCDCRASSTHSLAPRRCTDHGALNALACDFVARSVTNRPAASRRMARVVAASVRAALLVLLAVVTSADAAMHYTAGSNGTSPAYLRCKMTHRCSGVGAQAMPPQRVWLPVDSAFEGVCGCVQVQPRHHAV